jgi:hypothetical protein
LGGDRKAAHRRRTRWCSAKCHSRQRFQGQHRFWRSSCTADIWCASRRKPAGGVGVGLRRARRDGPARVLWIDRLNRESQRLQLLTHRLFGRHSEKDVPVIEPGVLPTLRARVAKIRSGVPKHIRCAQLDARSLGASFNEIPIAMGPPFLIYRHSREARESEEIDPPVPDPRQTNRRNCNPAVLPQAGLQIEHGQLANCD